MVVNNNFSGEKMGTSQVFMESGPPPKQAPSHNVQILANPSHFPPSNIPTPSYPSPHSPYQQQPFYQQQPNYG